MSAAELTANLILIATALVITLLIWFDPIGRWYRRRRDRRRDR